MGDPQTRATGKPDNGGVCVRGGALPQKAQAAKQGWEVTPNHLECEASSDDPRGSLMGTCRKVWAGGAGWRQESSQEGSRQLGDSDMLGAPSPGFPFGKPLSLLTSPSGEPLA